MAAEDVRVQHFLIYKVGPLCAILGLAWLFREKIKYHTIRRSFAWLMNKITARLNRGLGKHKGQLFKFVNDFHEKSNADLNILEVGSGSAANLPFLPPNTKLVCLDPNPHFVGYIKKNLKKCNSIISAEIVQGYAENMQLESAKFDVVLSTLVLCSVDNVEKSLEEIKRVLKPGGMFAFLEHVAAEKHTWRWVTQCIMNPFHWTFGDGCEVKRDLGKFIKSAGFSQAYVEKFYPRAMPFWCQPCILGTAIK